MMLRARYIIVEEATGIVLNAFIVEDHEYWPPPALGTITIPDNQKTYSVNDVVSRETLNEIINERELYGTR